MLGAGCESHSSQPVATGAALAKPSVQILTSEPAGAVGVGAVPESTNQNETVTVVGRIGGSENPFVDGLAAFTIVDPKVAYCAPDEGCPTPWDYCCTTDQLPGNIATVQIVNAARNVVEGDAKSLLNVKELSMVVVQGTAERDDAGNLTLLAEKVFVRPNSDEPAERTP
jgi:hypothetical protein